MTAQEKDQFWLMGEVIHGDYSRWANSEMCHSVTNYELSKGLWSGHNDHNYFEIAHTIRRQFDANGGIYKGRVLYTFADNHDVSRVVNLLKDRRHLKPLYTLVYTLPGVPSVYYGSEFGIEGRKEDGDPALRPAINLEEITAHPPVEGLEEFLETLGRVRTDNRELFDGAYQELLLTNRQYAFARVKDGSAFVTAVNNDENPADMWIRMPVGGTVKDLLTGEVIEPESGQLHVKLEADGCGLYRIN